MIPEDIISMKTILEEHESRIKKLEAVFTSEKKPIEKGLSIKEFLLSKKPKNDVQKTVAIAYFLEQHQNMKSFTAKDLENGFRESKEKVPDNINYKVIRCIQQGFLQEEKEKKDKLKSWSLTNSGQRFVEKISKKNE